MFGLVLFLVAFVPAMLCLKEDLGQIAVFEEKGLI